MRIRPASPADVALILRFIRELARYERLEHLVVATEETVRETLFGERPYAEVIIAEADGQPVGFALFFHNYSTFLGQPGIYLEDLFVVPEGRGRGYGKALLAELARIAMARNCGRVEWAVLNWNRPAIDFYQSLGAKAQSEWQVYRVTGEALEKLAAVTAPGS
ncbi:MAG TPA: GNAT family N-acetyltransferase [Thermoanaerobaculia bacterium]|jgi:GNAT superfamily N-acetyltransferase|nr:GNAT family N-acetyltransferase [Thermoanaerobaculia bacterium]